MSVKDAIVLVVLCLAALIIPFFIGMYIGFNEGYEQGYLHGKYAPDEGWDR